MRAHAKRVRNSKAAQSGKSAKLKPTTREKQNVCISYWTKSCFHISVLAHNQCIAFEENFLNALKGLWQLVICYSVVKEMPELNLGVRQGLGINPC